MRRGKKQSRRARRIRREGKEGEEREWESGRGWGEEKSEG